MCHLNEICPKIYEFIHFFENSGVVICISETWLKSIKSDNLVEVRGYNLVRADRISDAGGVAMFVKSSIPMTFRAMAAAFHCHT